MKSKVCVFHHGDWDPEFCLMRNILYRDDRSGGLDLVMRSSIEMIGNIDAFHSLLILGSWEIWRQGNPTHSSPECFTVNAAFHDNVLMCECHVFLSDVSVELPFTLMHPKPLDESVYTDGKSLIASQQVTMMET